MKYYDKHNGIVYHIFLRFINSIMPFFQHVTIEIYWPTKSVFKYKIISFASVWKIAEIKTTLILKYECLFWLINEINMKKMSLLEISLYPNINIYCIFVHAINIHRVLDKKVYHHTYFSDLIKYGTGKDLKPKVLTATN